MQDTIAPARGYGALFNARQTPAQCETPDADELYLDILFGFFFFFTHRPLGINSKNLVTIDKIKYKH